jgi:hypothetical protein
MGLFGSSKNSKRVLANLTVKDLQVSRSYELIAWFDDQWGPEEVVVPRAASMIERRFRVCYPVLFLVIFVRCASSNKMEVVLVEGR